MWLIVTFDLPTTHKADRKAYAQFRKGLQALGFTMRQYSVYERHCPSREKAEAYIEKVRRILPPRGKVSILQITDKQFGMIRNFYGNHETPKPLPEDQVQMY